LFRFLDAAAPAAFIDRRRGVCSLVYHMGSTPDGVIAELREHTLPLGDRGAASAWKRVTRARARPNDPPTYFLKVGEGESFGLCTTLFEDLRFQDNSPATMVRVSTCRLGQDEKTDNG
jgi:hypothetical protein